MGKDGRRALEEPGMGGRRRPRLRRLVAGTALVTTAALGLAACGGRSPIKPSGSTSSTAAASASPSTAAGPAASGGTATLAEGAQGQPNFILPFPDAAELTVANADYFSQLLYRPLYFFGDNGGVGLNEAKSIAYPPVYSDGRKTVTVRLKHWAWSDGHPVTSRDVTFFLNLLKANKDNFGSYVAGQIPDNLVSYKATGPYTLVLHLNRAYNTTWYTDNQLGLIVPMPQHVWDKTSAGGKVGNYDQTISGAKAVYRFLDSQSKDISTYDTNPLWKVVDGAWKLQSFQNTGQAVFVPNSRFSGPDKPHLSKFEELPFTSDAAEFDTLLSRHLDVGYLPPADLPRASQVSASGYHLVRSEYFQVNFIVLNFNNPVVGPLVRQLYIRQALQHLMDQQGQVRSILLGKGGYPDYGPIPPQPKSPYLSPAQEHNPYPFSVQAARKLLTSHGWRVPSSGPAVCARPGTGPSQCGAGIPAGKKLELNLVYASGSAYLQREMANYKSDAGQAGVVLNLSSAPFNTVVSETLPCKASQASCSWQLATWGAGFAWSYSSYPEGSLLFACGAPDNSSSYCSAKADSLIQASLRSSSSRAMAAYDAYVTKQLPVIWQICTYTLNEVANNLKGVTFNAVGPITPEDWYLSR
jgi:peptide/nickel transport system substrate-binding protein